MHGLVAETTVRGQSVLEVLQLNHVDWMHACGGKGRCTTCKMTVVSGLENLAQLTVHEKRFREAGLIGKNERLTCQAVLDRGLIEIEVPQHSKTTAY